MNLFELYEKLSSDEILLTIEKINNAINNFSRFGEKLIESYIAFDNWWQTAYANLYFLNIMETLMALFQDTENFTNEPKMINRNYVVHGMSTRTVTEIDCFKVWSALYSLVVMLPLLEELKV